MCFLDLISKYFRPILNDLNKSYYNHMGIFKIEGIRLKEKSLHKEQKWSFTDFMCSSFNSEKL
jgi:hypothetical protein